MIPWPPAPLNTSNLQGNWPDRSCRSRKMKRPCAGLRTRKNSRHRREPISRLADGALPQVAPIHGLQPPYNLFERAMTSGLCPMPGKQHATFRATERSSRAARAGDGGYEIRGADLRQSGPETRRPDSRSTFQQFGQLDHRTRSLQ